MELDLPVQSNDETFCKAPEVWRVISNYGEIRPCCVYRGDLGRLQDGGLDHTKLMELKTALSKGQRVPECSHCWFSENSNIVSHRLKEPYWKKQENQIQWLEFNFSNICNLTCIMCNSDSSTSWIPFEKELVSHPTTSFRPSFGNQLVKAFENSTDLEKYLDSFDISKIKRLVFKGGEPLLQEEVFQTIDYFIKHKKTDIKVQFTSSGLLANQRLKQFELFSEVEFTLSVEAPGPLYQYIRGGLKYPIEKVEESIEILKTFKNFKIISNSCILAYSYFHIVPLIGWLKQKIPDLPKSFLRTNLIPLDSPQYLSYKAIPKEVRLQAFEHNCNMMRNDGGINSEIEMLLRDILKLQEPHDPKLLEQFVAFTNRNDFLRKMRFIEMVPGYASLF